MIKAFGRDEYINCEPEDLIPRPGALTDAPDAKKDGTSAAGKAKESGGAKDAAASQPKAKPDKKEEKKKDD
jgi:hypothetical protein